MKAKHSMGFSLLEVLVALGILSVVLPGLVAMFMGSKSAQVGSFAAEQASQLAEGKLDSLRWLGRPMMPLSGTWSTNQPTNLNGKSATWRWKFDTAAVSAQRAGAITVEVTWQQSNTPHTITLYGGVL